MKLFFTLSFVLLGFTCAFGQRSNYGQRNTYREAVSLYREDPNLFAGTVYAIYMVPIGTYRERIQDRGWGVGIENRISLLRGKSAFKPIYNVYTTINRWNSNGSLGTDIVLGGLAGVNYMFPNTGESIKTYVQGLLGVGAAGSYLLQNRGYAEEINHQGIGPLGSLGTGVYFNRIHFGLSLNLFNVTLKNETEVNKNMSSLHIRVGARL
ncbi:MAG: hypothetical protein JWQ14_930 [Adhaeribacter sp.]|nr:hypothetical protein [Adhaeribacter sp.]